MRRGLAALLLGAAVVGCGSDESKSTPVSEGTIGAKQWSTKVTSLCEENRQQAKKVVADLQRDAREKGWSQTEFTAALVERSVESTEPMLDKLEAVPDPEGREKQAQRFIKLLRDTMPLFERTAEALKDQDREALEETNDRLMQVAGESRELARRLQIEACIPPTSRG